MEAPKQRMRRLVGEGDMVFYDFGGDGKGDLYGARVMLPDVSIHPYFLFLRFFRC